MEVILSKDIDRVGKAGQTIEVKDGFARNFLIPNNLAFPATAANLKRLEQDKQKKAQQLEKVKKDAAALKEQLERLSLTVPVLTHEEDRLYAGITTVDLAALLKDEGFDIDRTSILLDEPLKALGIYEVSVKLHPEVLAKIKIWVVKK